MVIYRARRWATGVALVALAAGSTGAQAQVVVQPLPPAGSQELSSALQRLARDGNDISALIDAGDAAVGLGDIVAAIGFFGRAQALDPSNPRISLGLARAYTLSRRPVEALRLYAQAESGGIPLQVMAADRGLAFDLVGDSRSAQDLYRMALAAGADDTVRRNLALSQAISNDRAGFEATLLPLLEQGDSAAFRTRAFGLAILGDTDAAIKIARDMMPGQAAAQVEPYLRYMNRLTPAQQAAAGALGIFPRTAAIGRDDAEIAGYDPDGSRTAKNADTILQPGGAPMGARVDAPSRRNSGAGARTLQRSEDRRQRRGATRNGQAATPEPVSLIPSVRDEATQPVELGERAAQSAPPQPSQTVDQAFATFDLGSNGSTARRVGAVDISAFEAPREVAEAPPAKHPSRHWVQVATGQDRRALAFDWRRIARKAEGALEGKGPFVTPWGQANRLLAGPYPSKQAARYTVNRLNELGIDTFPFTSEDGELIEPLD